MKNFYPYSIIILFVTLILTGSCGQNDYPSSLYTADSLASANPDSAIIFLAQHEDEMKEETEHTRVYYSLLKLKANDKAYVKHTSDSIIMSIVEYYEERDDKRHLPEAYYYAGRVCSDLGDAPLALEYFNKGMDAIGERTDIQALKQKDLLYSQMGTLLTYQNSYDRAMDVYMKTYEISKILNDTISIIYNLRDLANTFRFLEENDSAEHYFTMANDLVEQTDNMKLKAMIKVQTSLFYTYLNNYDKALDIHGRINSNHLKNKESYNLLTGNLHYYLGNTDSAKHYFKSILEYGNIYRKKGASRKLLLIAQIENRLEDANKHLINYLYYEDSINKLKNIEATLKVQSLYNYQLQEKENAMLEAENKDKTIVMTIFISSSLTLTILVLLLIQHIKKKRAEEEISKQEAEYNRLLILHKEERIDHLRETLLTRMSIIKKIDEGKTVKLEDKDWTDITRILEDVDDGFVSRLKNLCPEIKTTDLGICMLERLKLSNKQMADIMKITVEGVKKRKQRMKSKYFMNFDSELNLDSILDSIAKNHQL